MRSSRRTDSEGSAPKAFRVTASETILKFVFKTIVPLIPIAIVASMASLIMNSEVTGDYDGLAPGLGAVKLSLTEDNDELSGKLRLRRNDRYVIVEGKMLDDNKMEIRLRKELPDEIVEAASSAQISSSNSTIDSKLADQLSKEPQVSTQEEIKIQASKDQNDITGTLEINGNEAKFTASRSSFAAFFGKRWINRSLNYFGFKIKL